MGDQAAPVTARSQCPEVSIGTVEAALSCQGERFPTSGLRPEFLRGLFQPGHYSGPRNMVPAVCW